MEVTVLGCAIGHSAHGGYDSMVTLQINVEDPDGTVHMIEPFGPFDVPIDGNVNNGNSIRRLIFGMWSADSRVSVTGRSYEWDGNDITASSSWSVIDHTENSYNNPYVFVLRDGDTPPTLPGFADQASAEQFVAPYIDDATGNMKLGTNQAIFLFELGASSTSSSGYDLQDAVVLLTLGENLVTLDANAAAHD